MTSGETAVAREPITILVVDDDPLIAMSTVDMLQDLGHLVREAGSGAEALEILAADPDIALVVTDQSMPGMTGAQLARQARARRPDLPVLLASGYGAVAEDPSLPTLVKPFLQADLERAIHKVLGRT